MPRAFAMALAIAVSLTPGCHDSSTKGTPSAVSATPPTGKFTDLGPEPRVVTPTSSDTTAK